MNRNCGSFWLTKWTLLWVCALAVVTTGRGLAQENDRSSIEAQYGAPQLAVGNYDASEFAGVVVLRATGSTPTPGYRVYFTDNPNEPHHFTLWQVAATGVFPQLITPFSVQKSFTVSTGIRSVHVTDARGTHVVPVVPLQMLQRGGGESGTPFRGGGDNGTPFNRPSEGPGPLGQFSMAKNTATHAATIGHWLDSHPDFTRLRHLLQRGGLLNRLHQQGHYTLFAFTNTSFAALSVADRVHLLNQNSAKNVAQYHLIAGQQKTLPEILRMRSIHMSNGVQAWVHSMPHPHLRDQRNGRAAFIDTHENFSNGVVHVINAVLWPDRQTAEETKYQQEATDFYRSTWPTGTVSFTSTYQTTPLRLTRGGHATNARRVNLIVDFDAIGDLTGSLRLDPSECQTTNHFGDAENCAAGTEAPVPVRLKGLYEADPSGKNRALLSIRKPGSHSSPLDQDLYLVVPTHEEDSFRFVAIQASSQTSVASLTLEIDRDLAPLCEETSAKRPEKKKQGK